MKSSILFALALSCAMLARPAQGQSNAAAFDTVVNRVGVALHARPRRRSLLGTSLLFVHDAGPIGPKHMQVALFDLDGEPTPAQRADVGAALQAVLAAPWQLVAHQTSRYGDDESWVYARPEGVHSDTVVCRLQRGQTTVVIAEEDPLALLNGIDQQGVVIWSHQSVVRGLWGGLGDGSGFGPGLAFETAAGLPNLAQLHGSAKVTYEGYLGTSLGIRIDPTGGDMHTFSLDLTGRYNVSPSVDFFGQGPSSPAQRAVFNLQERGAALTFGVRPSRTLKFGIGADYSGNRVFGGNEDGYANAQSVFAAQALPGMARGANLISGFAFAQYDGRDFPEAAHSGTYLRLSAADNEGTGHSNFHFWNYRADGRAYLPLKHFSDVLAGRVLAIWNRPEGGGEVPFFRLAELGDSDTLRGYRPYRFHGLNAATASLEYRHYFDDDWGAFLFGDVGQVYDFRAELTRRNMRATWGGGLLFNDGRKTSFKIFFGTTSDEGHRWFLTLGPTF
ncbi:MAG TPA: BamA/TamA family outer membrane protein [Terriglobales bacterium]|nr:BamA/TamA family outer membrane protein [Terriglobales bacterium]